MRYGIDESYWEEIKSVFSQFPKIKKAILFVDKMSAALLRRSSALS